MDKVIVCTEVVGCEKDGVIVKSNNKSFLIALNECAKNYAKENSLSSSKCVATRNITMHLFTFYTNPKTMVVFKKNFFKELFTQDTATSRFHKLQKLINERGYHSYDLS